jgi:hypothetical protein
MAFENESRKSFRAPIVDRYEGTLRFSEAKIRVTMVDQSATGFKLSTDDPRPIPKLHAARLEMDDGAEYDVQIRHVQRDGELRTLGVQLVERQPADPNVLGARRRRVAKWAAAALLVAASGIALQAAPIRNRIFSPGAGGAASATPGTVATPKFDRERPFDFRRYVEDDVAAWLPLSPTQCRGMRDLLGLADGARARHLPPVQLAMVDFAAEASVLQLLEASQRERLEKELGRPMTGSALLDDVVRRYASQVRTKELSEKFGGLLVVSPEIATEYGVSKDAVDLVRRRLDEAVPPVPPGASKLQDGVDSEHLMLEFTVRLTQLEAECRELLVAKPAKPK